jgi:hypothetical protein
MESDQQLENMVSAQGQIKVELVGRLQNDEELQCAAVGALLERSDARSWSLVQQVTLVQSQLAALTAVEMERRKLQISEQVVCIFCQNNICNKENCRVVGPPLWSSGQSSWLQIRRPEFESRHYQKKKVVGLERGPLSLVSTN